MGSSCDGRRHGRRVHRRRNPADGARSPHDAGPVPAPPSPHDRPSPGTPPPHGTTADDAPSPYCTLAPSCTPSPHSTSSAPRSAPHQVRHLLAGLVLAVLTLLGGAPAAAGAALPAQGAAVAHTDRPAGPLAPRHTHAAHRAAHTIRAGASASGGAARVSGPSAATRPVDVRRADADPAPRPRAGADRPHAPHHLPPPGHAALPPCPHGLPPRGAAPLEVGAGPIVVVRVRATLPGVRGPPGVTAAQAARHRSCSADLSPRPL